MIPRAAGWIKDKRKETDYLLTAGPSKAIPEVTDLSKFLPKVRNQGNQGSCVGHGIGGILTGKAIQLGVFEEWFSPRWIYYGGRYLGGYVNYDNGTEPRFALDWCLKKGCALESVWQYQSGFNPAPPPDAAYTEALKRPLLTYTRVVDGVDGICSALAGNSLVAVGSPWYNKWGDTDSKGRLSKIKCWDKLAGGHEYILWGHNLSNELFGCQNSWGEDWGSAGRMYLPFQAINQFKRHGGYDAHVIEVNWTKLKAIREFTAPGKVEAR